MAGPQALSPQPLRATATKPKPARIEASFDDIHVLRVRKRLENACHMGEVKGSIAPAGTRLRYGATAALRRSSTAAMSASKDLAKLATPSTSSWWVTAAMSMPRSASSDITRSAPATSDSMRL